MGCALVIVRLIWVKPRVAIYMLPGSKAIDDDNNNGVYPSQEPPKLNLERLFDKLI